MVNTREEYCSVCVSPPAASVSTPEKLGWPSHLVAHAPTAGPGGRRRWFQEPAGGPIVPMAWLLLRNDHLVYELCPELKGASFETLGAKVAELGLTLDFDIAAELARIDAKKMRSPARTSAHNVLRSRILTVLGAGLKAQLRVEREAAGSAPQVLAPSNRGRAHT